MDADRERMTHNTNTIIDFLNHLQGPPRISPAFKRPCQSRIFVTCVVTTPRLQVPQSNCSLILRSYARRHIPVASPVRGLFVITCGQVSCVLECVMRLSEKGGGLVTPGCQENYTRVT